MSQYNKIMIFFLIIQEEQVKCYTNVIIFYCTFYCTVISVCNNKELKIYSANEWVIFVYYKKQLISKEYIGFLFIFEVVYKIIKSWYFNLKFVLFFQLFMYINSQHIICF